MRSSRPLFSNPGTSSAAPTLPAIPDRQNWRDIFFTSRDGLRLYARHYPAPGSSLRPVLCLPGLTRNSRDFHQLASVLSSPQQPAPRHSETFSRASVSFSTVLAGSRWLASRHSLRASSARPTCHSTSPRCTAISASGCAR